MRDAWRDHTLTGPCRRWEERPLRTDRTSACLECLVRHAAATVCPRCGGDRSVDLRDPDGRARALRRIASGEPPRRTRRSAVKAWRSFLQRLSRRLEPHFDDGYPSFLFNWKLWAVWIAFWTLFGAIFQPFPLPDKRWFMQAVFGAIAPGWAGIMIAVPMLVLSLLVAALIVAGTLFIPCLAIDGARALLGGLPDALHRARRRPLTLALDAHDTALSPARQTKSPPMRGVVKARTPLRAPLSGRACAAYRLVGDAASGPIDDAALGELELELSDGTRAVLSTSAASVDLPVPGARVAVEGNDALSTFLADRSVPRSAARVRLAEAVLADGDEVEIEGAATIEHTQSDGYRQTTPILRLEPPPGGCVRIRRVAD